jgi:hypothetical protein
VQHLLNVVLLYFIIHGGSTMFVCFFFFCFFFFVTDENEIVSDAESDDNEDQCEWKLIDDDGNVEQPKKGMTFDSIEELKSYYRHFGKQMGFGMVQKKVAGDKISKKEVRVTIACACQGKLAPKASKPNPTTKTDCKAKLNAKLVETN